MNSNISDLLNDIRTTIRYRIGVEQLAQKFVEVPSETLELLIQSMIDQSEYEALGKLYLVIAINKSNIDLELLLKGAKYVDNILDTFAPFQYSSAEAVPGLLDLAMSDEISWERQAFAVFHAAYLIRQFKLEQHTIEKIIKKLMLDISSDEAYTILVHAKHLLDEKTDLSKFPYNLFLAEPLDLVPEERPPKVIASGYTVKRATAKINRNAPCPCGSGKKYKKCCMLKDEAAQSGSPHRERIFAESIYQPAELSDHELIDNLRPFELEKLAPKNLNDNQLFFVYERLVNYGHLEKAFQVLLELEAREKRGEYMKGEFDTGHFNDLLDNVLRAGDLELVEKILPKVKNNEFYNKELIEFQIYLLKKHQHLEKFEEMCEKTLYNDLDLIELSYIIYDSKYPAIFLMLFRAIIASLPERYFDIEVLMDLVQKARIDLNLDEIDDPSFDNWDVICDKVDQKELTEQQLTENVELKKQLKEIQTKVGKISLELSQKEKEIQKLEKAKKELKAVALKADAEKSKKEETVSADEAIENLHRRTKNLQAELKNQQQIRSDLRQQVQKSRTMISTLLKEKEKGGAAEEKYVTQSAKFDQLPEKIVVPEYFPNFRKQADQLPAEIIAKALTAVNGIVLNKAEIWKQTTSIETFEDLYRIRLGRQYRLMMRWKPGKFLHVLDIIPRNKLETWLKQFE